MFFLRVLALLSIVSSFAANAEPKTYALNDGVKAKILSVFDCTPAFSGKAALGDDKFVFNWECENNTNAKYAIYKTSYTSRFDFAFSQKSEVVDFFNKYLQNKASTYYQNPRMTDVRYGILSAGFTSRESSYADYYIFYKWDRKFRLQRQGRFIFRGGYIADWSVTSQTESGIAAEEFNFYVKYFDVVP